MTPAEFIDNPKWADCVPERKGPQRARHLPTHEDCTRLDAEKVADHLRRGGTLGTMPGYEERAGQIAMTSAIARAFNNREHLMIEAGTGVGKSLAYLLPSVQWAYVNDTPVIVSTATRNLQSQLITSDIPRALKTLGGGAADFRVALLKGRGNYVCLRAVGDFFAAGFWTMSEDEQAEMPHFIEWLRTTEDGDLDRYEAGGTRPVDRVYGEGGTRPVDRVYGEGGTRPADRVYGRLPRNLLTCPGEECGGRRCPYYSRCFLYRARQNAAEAHLVVANHALVLADATAPGGGILPASGRLVLDEAHNLEKIATDYLSREFSLPALTRLLNRLMRRGKGKRTRPGGILASVDRQLAKGVLRDSSVASRIGALLRKCSSLTVRTVNAAEALADLGALLLTPGKQGRAVRYRVQDGTRQYSVEKLFRPYGEDWNEVHFKQAENAFEAEVAVLVSTLHDLRDTLELSVPEGELNFFGDVIAQLDGIAQSFVDFATTTDFVLSGEKETHAFWVERVHPADAGSRPRPAYVRLVAAPLSVAEDLRKLVWDMKDSVILSSATLRVGNDFRYMTHRLGFRVRELTEERPVPETDRYRCLTAESPFDYFRQALVLAPDCLSDPSADPMKYAEDLAALMRDLFDATEGRALVLFTSYEMMNAVAAHARHDLADAGIALLVQGEGLSRESITARLRKGGRTVVFGAQSFWEGVDVAGEALSCVVIARLPFAQVGDPIVEARSEKIDRAGGSSFRDYYLPEAVITFRQGFGRLIRTREDRGVVIVTDPRLVTKNYGATFRRSLPTSVHTVTERGELLERVRGFFEGL